MAGMFDDGPERSPQPNRYARPDAQGTLPIWNGRSYEYPPDPRLIAMQQAANKNKLMEALMRGGMQVMHPMGGMR